MLHIQWSWSDDHRDDEPTTLTEIFWRDGNRWKIFDADGGGGWHTPPSARPPRAPEQVVVGGSLIAGEPGRAGHAVDGEVGNDVVEIELEDGDGITVRPVESPLGVFVVAFDAYADATIRLRTRSGRVVAEHAFPAYL